MKKILLFSLLFATTVASIAQETKEDEPVGWSDTLKVALIFNQSAFNAEWTGGGTSNIAGDLSTVYKIHYRKNGMTWDNRLVGNYGLTRTKDSEFTRKTSDRLEFHSTLAKRISGSEWHYSFFTNLRTQFAKGYEFYEDPDTGEERRTEITNFFSPAYLQAGPGIMWKKNKNLKVNFAPATARLIFVDRKFTTVPGYEDGDYFGVEQGKSTRYEFGAAVSGYAKFDIMNNVNMEHILNLYSNYLDKPSNVDIDYTLNTVMSINKYLSANFIFQAIYDDNAVGAFQIREVFGVGVTFQI